MDELEALRAQARAVASRMEARLGTALGANREMTAEEQTANAADEAELAELKGKITAAEAAAAGNGTGGVGVGVGVAAVLAAERTRVLALVDLCPSSVVGSSLRTAIEGGTDAGAFAIVLAKASKARGASVADLKDGAVQAGQLPNPAAKTGADKGKPKTGAEQATGILALAASVGHRAVAAVKG
jgi:hypothetical protein